MLPQGRTVEGVHELLIQRRKQHQRKSATVSTLITFDATTSTAAVTFVVVFL
jgi:hypothetical protein